MKVVQDERALEAASEGRGDRSLVEERVNRPSDRSRTRRRWRVHLTQAALLGAMLICWQVLPQVDWFSSRFRFMDPYFVGSPTQVAEELARLTTGSDGRNVWPFVWQTVSAASLGLVIGMVAGALSGLLLSNFSFLSAVMRPFVVAANATPRVALIPIIVIILGPTFKASVTVAVLVVFFLAFFNAYEGGTTVRSDLVENARLLGANQLSILAQIRLPFVLAWTMAGLPLAISFSLISVVTAEILTGTVGLGSLLQTAQITGDSTLTFAVVVILASVGLAVVMAGEAVKGRVLHWWGR